MPYPYDRLSISGSLALLSNSIPASLYVSRQGKYDEEVEFTFAFFLHRNKQELQKISVFVSENYSSKEEVLVHFFKKRENSIVSLLTKEEMKNFDFSSPYVLSRLSPSWDELREISQQVIGIVFS